MKTRYFHIILFTFIIVGCKTPENNENREKEYIINEHNFGNYKKFDHDKSDNELKTAQQNAASQTKEDSLKQYLKKITHDFKLQEKQVKALEYIYSKYNKKEAAAKAQNDTTQLDKILAEKEKSIEVVIGEHYYAQKVRFDQRYLNQIKNPNGLLNDSELDNYLSDLATAINFDDNKKAAFKRLVKSYDKSIVKAKPKAVKVLKSKRNEAIKNLLGEDLFNQKIAFDKTYPKPVN